VRHPDRAADLGRSTYAEIGALAWLARLDAFADAPVPASS